MQSSEFLNVQGAGTVYVHTWAVDVVCTRTTGRGVRETNILYLF